MAARHNAPRRRSLIAAGVARIYAADARQPVRVGSVASVAVLAALGVLLCAPAWAQTTRVPVNALPTNPRTTFGTPITYTPNNTPAAGARATATITQTAPTNIVQWSAFDIGKNASVQIVQPSANSVLLNKVDSGAYLSKTVIDGMLNANGRVYIYNPNGIIFGKTATVDVNTLIASSLKFDEARIKSGLNTPSANPLVAADPAFAGTPGNITIEGDGSGRDTKVGIVFDASGHATLQFRDAQGNPVTRAEYEQIKDRALLTAGSNGQIFMFAPNITNNGVLAAPDGQVILAAGNKAYMYVPNTTNPDYSTLRGVVVEVRNDYASAAGAPPADADGTPKGVVENSAGGNILPGRGNASLIGYAVNQKGIISASTSVSLNGSIYLRAQDQADTPDANRDVAPRRSGPLLLGQNSVNEILPTLQDQTTLSQNDISKTFKVSEALLRGQSIELQSNASIVAPGGSVKLEAAVLRPSAEADTPRVFDPKTDASRIDLAADSLIDVSGSSGTQLAMEKNVITLDLRVDQVADNVVLRDSPLYGSSVRVDIRKNTSYDATQALNVSKNIALVQRGLGEINTAGGTVKLSAESAIIQREGSTVKVDGGAVDYLPGYVNTSKFKLNEALVDVASAKSGVPYTAIVNLPDSPLNFEAGYRQGSNAGSVTLQAPIVVAQGQLSGKAVAGENQRNVAATGYPKGASLTVNLLDAPYLAGGITLGGRAETSNTPAPQPPASGQPFEVTDAGQRSLAAGVDLDTTKLAAGGFSRITAKTPGNITVDAPVILPAGGALTLTAAPTGYSNPDGTANDQGGNISFAAGVTIPGGSLTATAAQKTLSVADGVAFDLAGRWVNDRALSNPPLNAAGLPVAPISINGGSLNFSTLNLNVGNNVSADVSAGAYLGMTASTATTGSAGKITLEARPLDVDNAPGASTSQTGSGLQLSGYGFTTGGTLTMKAQDLTFDSGAFREGGFTTYDIGSYGNLTVAANANIKPSAESWVLSNRAALTSSGSMQSVATPTFLALNGPPGSRTRPATNVSLRAIPETTLRTETTAGRGRLLVDSGASISMDPGANLNLYAGRQMTVEGTLNAPGGNILLSLTPVVSTGFDARRSIWFGAKSEVNAAGTLQRLYTNPDGVSNGDVLDGGSIKIIGRQDTVLDSSGIAIGTVAHALAGYIVAERGATFDVSGAGPLAAQFSYAGRVTPVQTIGGVGGSIEMRARDGYVFGGKLKGDGGAPSGISVLAGGGISSGNGTVATGGSLTVVLDREGQNLDSSRGPTNERVLGLLPNTSGNIYLNLSGLNPDDKIFVTTQQTDGSYQSFLSTLNGTASGRLAGQGYFTTSAFQSGGFSRLNFKSQDVIGFGLGTGSATVNLSAADAVVLDAPAFRAFTTPPDAALKSGLTTASAGTSGAVPPTPTVNVTAPTVRLGSANPAYQVPGDTTGGDARFNANATTIDLIGRSATQRFGDVRLTATEDIRLVGVRPTDGLGGTAPGSLDVTGNLTLTSTQTYPVTFNDYTLSVKAPAPADAGNIGNGSLTFAANGTSSQPVLSAAGSLTAVAKHIVQGGHLLAPFGAITLGTADDTDDVKFLAGSVTSVAGAGAVPFGTVSSGSVPSASAWNYQLDAVAGGTVKITQSPDPFAPDTAPERALPVKSLVTRAKSITTETGSIQDVAGGGSLFAYEFTPGKGGTLDVLANNNAGSTSSVFGLNILPQYKMTTFAINPNYNRSVAPLDGSYGRDGGLATGDSVYLSGMAGLAAGRYTLLPAHYALLPGGYSVTIGPKSSVDMQASSNTVQPDGSMLMAGRLMTSGSGTGNTRTLAFIVQPGSVVNNKSAFTQYDASGFFAEKAAAAGVSIPELPVDGGYAAFAMGTVTGFALNGSLNLTAAEGGRAGTLDISAPNMAVVSSRSQAPSAGVLNLVAGELNNLGADSIVLGATRSNAGNTTQLTVGASTLTVANDAQNALAAADIVLAANANLTIAAGAAVQSTGVPARSSQALTLDGSGALLRVSGGDGAAVTRSTSANTTGTLTIGEAAKISATGSVNLDATRNVTLNGRLEVANGGALSIGAPNISFGSDIPLATAGLRFDNTALADFGGLSQLSFNGYGNSIGLYGTAGIALDQNTNTTLSFKGAGFQAFGTANDSTARQANLSAASVRFDGAATEASPLPLNPAAGTLTVTAKTIAVGDNAFAIRGYDQINLNAGNEVLAAGSGGQLVSDQKMTLAAGRITTATGSSAAFKAGAALTLTTNAGATPAINAAAPGAGGQLLFQAASITSDAQILAPSGSIAMLAGLTQDPAPAATNAVTITGGQLSVAGASTVFGTAGAGLTTAYAPAGTIVLGGGTINVGADAKIDLSATGAAAGALKVTARTSEGGGSYDFSGTLKASAVAGSDGLTPTQGQFALDADHGNPFFGALNQKLNAAGFSESRQFRFRNGDVALGGSDRVVAHEVGIAVDNGNLTIGGAATIDASGAQGGSVELYAAQSAAGGNSGRVVLMGNASIIARGTAPAVGDAGSNGNGGRVVIGSGNASGAAAASIDGGGSIALNGGSIDVSGASVARGGSVTLRAPRLGDGSDVAVSTINTTIVGNAATRVEAFKVYQASSISEQADSATNLDAGHPVINPGRMFADASGFTNVSGPMAQRLTAGGAGNLSIVPGIEVRSPSGDLTVSVNEFARNPAERGWDLGGWRFNDAPIALSLRAAGNLNIVGSISDGFVKPTNTALSMPNWQLASGNSASYRLVGGADFSGADPLAVKPGSGDVSIKFADRTPAVTDVAWKSTDGSLTSATVSAAAANAPLTNTDAPVALVRSGTGSIEVRAGRDFNLGMAKFFVVDNAADPTVDGTPVIYDRKNSDNTYNVSVYGATVYTAGRTPDAAAAIDPSVFALPQNKLNTHYGAAASTKTDAAFGVNGGAISVNAGRNINGPGTLAGSWFYRNADGVAADPTDDTPATAGTAVLLPAVVPQLVNNWLYRQGRSYQDAQGNRQFEAVGVSFPPGATFPERDINSAAAVAALAAGRDLRLITDENGNNVVYEFKPVNTAWWARPDYFSQGLATFGGGDVRIVAGKNINDLSASVASSAYEPSNTVAGTPASVYAASGVLKESGGGNLTVRAAGDILGGAYYTQKGNTSVQSAGAIAAGHYVPNANADDPQPGLKPVFAVGDGRVDVAGARGVAIETVYNPTLTEQSSNNANVSNRESSSDATPLWDITNTTTQAENFRAGRAQYSIFSTYGSNSAVNLAAAGGDVVLGNNAASLAVSGAREVGDRLGTNFQAWYGFAPSTFRAAALNGSVSSQGGFALAPAPQGQLDVLASASISFANGSTGSVRMLDSDPAVIPGALTARLVSLKDIGVMLGTQTGIAAHLPEGLHQNDQQPVRIIATNGDINGDSINPYSLSLPKAAVIQAGRDIVDLGFNIQHNASTDVTSMTAGRDVLFSTLPNNSVRNVVTGPGRIDISAARNVDLGNADGFITRGNAENPYLPQNQGASIQVVAGSQPDYSRAADALIQYGAASSVFFLTPSEATLMRSYFLDLLARGDAKSSALAVYANAANPQKAVLDASVASLLKVYYLLPQSSRDNFQSANPTLASLGEINHLFALIKSMQPYYAANLSVFGSGYDVIPTPPQLSQLRTFVLAQSANAGTALPASASAEQLLTAFGALPAALQSQFVSAHPGMPASLQTIVDLKTLVTARIPGLSATVAPPDLWTAFSTLATADREQFIAAHPALQTVLQARATQFRLALNAGTISAEDTWAAFRALRAEDQALFLGNNPALLARLEQSASQIGTALASGNKPQLNDLYFSSLVEGGNQKFFGLSNFDNRILSLFPAAGLSGGNISVYGSQFKTEQFGSIDLFAPAGSVYAGLPVKPSNPLKTPGDSNNGVFTIADGEIRSLVQNDFLVGVGRVFTVGGGDISLVTQFGDISAGSGSQTAASAPPPRFKITANSVSLDVSGTIFGSGIATLKTNPDVPAGDIFASAPRGTFDAGDAGVRSSGAVTINAQTVLNASNIAASGSVSGAAAAPVAAPSVGSVAAPAAATPRADEVAKGIANTEAEDREASLSVESVGYGDVDMQGGGNDERRLKPKR